MPSIWYVQLDPLLASQFFSTPLKFSNQLFQYRFDLSKTIRSPKVGDYTILIGKQFQLCIGTVVDMSDPNNPIMSLREVEPFPIQKSFRTIWTYRTEIN